MRVLIQRVLEARVDVAEETVGSIDRGLLVFVCAMRDDTSSQASWCARKIGAMRIFQDDEGRMNRSVTDIGGGILLVSQFTLSADVSRGNRPGFSAAAQPDQAVPLLDVVAKDLEGMGIPVSHGQFGADMKVHLINDGPVTIWIDTDQPKGGSA